NVDSKINQKFLELYADGTESDIKTLPQSIIEQVEVFAYQHKDAIFQKNIPQKGLRLYYNFAYPPFYKVFYKEDRDKIVNPFKNKLVKFLNDLVTAHTTDSDPIELSDISTVLCTGGGFEMLWARQAVEDVLPDSNVCNYKNSKAVAAYGASIISAARLGVINEKTFVICDKLKLNADIGLSVVKDGKTRFVPLFEKNSFWWQNNRKIRILINEAVNGRYSFPLIKRGESGDFITLGEITVDGFPKRPKGVTEILLHLEYISRDKIKINVKDFGFGEMFPANDINTEQILSI
ncbi:MAG: DUF5716 family protein, partial [Clostridiales bacterium]|nr:DUF5716 family protein [Clostridiales bacterium]